MNLRFTKRERLYTKKRYVAVASSYVMLLVANTCEIGARKINGQPSCVELLGLHPVYSGISHVFVYCNPSFTLPLKLFLIVLIFG